MHSVYCTTTAPFLGKEKKKKWIRTFWLNKNAEMFLRIIIMILYNTTPASTCNMLLCTFMKYPSPWPHLRTSAWFARDMALSITEGRQLMLMMVIVSDGGREAGRQIDSKILRDTCSYHYYILIEDWRVPFLQMDIRHNSWNKFVSLAFTSAHGWLSMCPVQWPLESSPRSIQQQQQKGIKL